MDERDKLRRKIWAELRRVARPDSRFHWDFTAFIPDFEGSERCTAALVQMDTYRKAATILSAPDNSLVGFRARALLDGKRLIVPTYALARGFWALTRADVSSGQEDFAATLDGLERFGRPFLLETAGPDDAPTLLVTGASVLNTEGVRISVGPSYFDLEWLILHELRLVTTQMPIVAVVHDCQVVEWPCEPRPYDAVVDRIVTPTRRLEAGRHPKPGGIPWEELPWNVISEVSILRTLYARQQASAS